MRNRNLKNRVLPTKVQPFIIRKLFSEFFYFIVQPITLYSHILLRIYLKKLMKFINIFSNNYDSMQVFTFRVKSAFKPVISSDNVSKSLKDRLVQNNAT